MVAEGLAERHEQDGRDGQAHTCNLDVLGPFAVERKCEPDRAAGYSDWTCATNANRSPRTASR